MKIKLFLVTFFCSFNLFAITTKLSVPTQPSTDSIEQAIWFLHRAQEAGSENDKAYFLNKARKLIKMTTKKITFQAAVYAQGRRQFNQNVDWGYEDFGYWEFDELCFKGSSQEAANLINQALALGFWESDEEWIDQASPKGAYVEILIKDGPNDEEWTETISACE